MTPWQQPLDESGDDVVTEILLGPDQPVLSGRTATKWAAVASASGLGLTELAHKAIYVAGLMRHLLESAGLCLRENLQLAAYLVAMGAFETLGPVVRDDKKMGIDDEAIAGIAYSAGIPYEGARKVVVVRSANGDYTAMDCLERRHFAAHGGKKFRGTGVVLDEELTIGVLNLLVSGLDRWWSAVQSEPAMQEVLAQSFVQPLHTAGQVLFVHQLSEPLTSGATPGGVVEYESSWRNRT